MKLRSTTRIISTISNFLSKLFVLLIIMKLFCSVRPASSFLIEHKVIQWLWCYNYLYLILFLASCKWKKEKYFLFLFFFSYWSNVLSPAAQTQTDTQIIGLAPFGIVIHSSLTLSHFSSPLFCWRAIKIVLRTTPSASRFFLSRALL